ncbi:MAG: Gldg family protein, partial [Nitrospinota bacterium]
MARVKALFPFLAGVLLVAGALLWAISERSPLTPLFLIAGACLGAAAIYMGFHELRGFIGKRSTRLGASSAVMTLTVLGIAIMVELISSTHFRRFDLTEAGLFTLSPQSLKILAGLEERGQKVKVTAFVREVERENYRDILDQYSYHTRNFSYTFVDPDRQPGTAKRYGITSYGTIVVDSGDKEEKVFSLSEEDLANALLRVTKPGRKVVYFLKGHGENDLDELGKEGYSQVKMAIEKENYEVKELVLLRAERVPEDAAVLVVSGPKKPPFPQELEMLRDYIARGGKLIFMLDPGGPKEVAEFLSEYGLELRDDVIVDRLSRLFGADYLMPVVTEYTKHKI